MSLRQGDKPVGHGRPEHGDRAQAPNHASEIEAPREDTGPVAFLGMGLMGAPMARRLAEAHYSVRVWNRSAHKAQTFAATSAQVMGTPAAAVDGARVVCLSLTDADAVETVAFGKGGFAAALRPGAVVIDFSSIEVERTRAFAARIGECGGAWIDAPVSGGVAGAASGSLVVFAGGARDDIDRVRPLLQHLASRVSHMGECGAGQATKLCNQLIVSTNLVAIAEAMALGEAMGIDVAQLPSALAGGFADSKPLQIFGPRMAVAIDPGPAVSEVRTMYKDVATIAATAVALDIELQLLQRAKTLYATLIGAGFGREDVPALTRLYRKGNA